MTLTPYTVDRFGPLNLTVDPAEVGATGATYVVDLDFDRPGRIHTRGGFTRRQAITMDTPGGLAAYESILSRQYIAGYTTGGTSAYKAYNAITGALVSSAAPSSPAISAAQINIGTAQNLYIANGNGGDTIWRWNGSAFSQPAGMPKASFLAVTPVSNRLVAAVVGTTLDRVQFSDAGAPETWTSTSWVDLPYGGGLISGVHTWQNNLFVFKTSGRFFVFTGESTLGDGSPEFNFRSVHGYGAYTAVSGDEGVYFSDGRSIWLTTGDIPTRVSTPIDPFLRGEQGLGSDTVDTDQVAQHLLTYSLGRLYVSVLLVGGSRKTLVFDPKVNAWTFYSLGINFGSTVRFAILAHPTTIWLSAAGVDAFDGSTTDNGASIQWFYRSGKYPLSDLGRVAITRESSVTAYSDAGTVTFDLSTEKQSPTGGTTVTVGLLSTSPQEGYFSVDFEGKLFRHTVSGTGPAAVNRVTHYVSFVKPVGVE